MEVVAAAGVGVATDFTTHTAEEFAAATPAQRLLWIAGMSTNADPEEDMEEDWSLDPWLYEVCVCTRERSLDSPVALLVLRGCYLIFCTVCVC